MTFLKATQIRAARALLGWSQEDMAKAAGLSIATIRKLELGYISPRTATTAYIRKSVEEAGVEFIEPEGVRKRPKDILFFENSGEAFLEDMKHTVKKDGGEILIVTTTANVFAKACGLEKITELDSLVDLNKTAEIKCLLTDEYDPPLSTPRFQFRSISKHYVDPTPFCVYGYKYGALIPLGNLYPMTLVLNSPSMAKASKRHFLSLWEKAMPMVAGMKQRNAGEL